MEKRMKNYLKLINERMQNNLPAEDKKIIKEDLLTQILFFQHERLIHLLVTLTFAILTAISCMYVLLNDSMIILVFLLLLLALLIPYIRHYFILENGVQKLYEYYDKL